MPRTAAQKKKYAEARRLKRAAAKAAKLAAEEAERAAEEAKREAEQAERRAAEVKRAAEQAAQVTKERRRNRAKEKAQQNGIRKTQVSKHVYAYAETRHTDARTPRPAHAESYPHHGGGAPCWSGEYCSFLCFFRIAKFQQNITHFLLACFLLSFSQGTPLDSIAEETGSIDIQDVDFADLPEAVTVAFINNLTQQDNNESAEEIERIRALSAANQTMNQTISAANQTMNQTIATGNQTMNQTIGDLGRDQAGRRHSRTQELLLKVTSASASA